MPRTPGGESGIVAPVLRSHRVPGLTLNRLSAARNALQNQGVPLIDLTGSNPTRAGLRYPDDLLGPLAGPGRSGLRPRSTGPPRGPRGGRRRARPARCGGRSRPGRPDRQHERGVRVPVQGAVRSRRRGARPGPELPAVRDPERARGGAGRALPARSARRLELRRRRHRRPRHRPHPRRHRGEPEQPDRHGAVDGRRPRPVGLLRDARPDAHRRRGLRGLPAARGERSSADRPDRRDVPHGGARRLVESRRACPS